MKNREVIIGGALAFGLFELVGHIMSEKPEECFFVQVIIALVVIGYLVCRLCYCIGHEEGYADAHRIPLKKKL